MLEDLPTSVLLIVEAAIQARAEPSDVNEARLASAVEAFQNKSRSFVGEASGDQECFCWKVDGATYEHISGHPAKSVWWSAPDEMYIYPHHVIPLGLVGASQKRYTVIVENV